MSNTGFTAPYFESVSIAIGVGEKETDFGNSDRDNCAVALFTGDSRVVDAARFTGIQYIPPMMPPNRTKGMILCQLRIWGYSQWRLNFMQRKRIAICIHSFDE